MTQKKKKKATTRELVVGGGVLALFSPLILFGLIGAGVALGVMILLLLVGIDIPTLGLAALVYGILFAIMLLVLVKFSVRFRLLLRRLIGIFRERRRYQNGANVFTAETDLDHDAMLQYDSDQHATMKRTD